MNVKNVIIINDFNYIQGGASKVAIQTAKILNESGIKTYFFSAVNKDDENIEGIEYITTNQKEALKEKNKFKGAINGIYNFKAKKTLKGLLKTLDNRNTIIHVHGWTKALSSSIFDIAFKMKFKVVLTLHDYFTACPNGGYFNYNKNKICHYKPLSWKCVRCNCDSRNYAIKIYRIVRQLVQNKIVKLNDNLEYTITISDFSENILNKTLNEGTRVFRINNPIDVSKDICKIDINNNKYYLYVGRVSKEKGVDLFCEALTRLKYDAIVVGDGNQKNILKNKYPQIQFVGWKSEKEVDEYIRNAKTIIMPSRWYECAPLTNIEALSKGVPSLVSSTCAASEISNEKNGTGGIFNLNIESIIEAITKIKLKKFNINNYNCILKNYTYTLYTTKLLNLYKKIINDKKERKY